MLLPRAFSRKRTQLKLEFGGERMIGFIFFLTFNANNLIYESHCDFVIAKF